MQADRSVAMAVLVLATCAPAALAGDRAGELVSEALSAARGGRTLEAREVALHAGDVARDEPGTFDAVAHLAAAARVLEVCGDPAAARRLRRERAQRMLADWRGPGANGSDTADHALGIALAERAQHDTDPARQRALAGEALVQLAQMPADARGVRGARGLALERLGRATEAWPLLVAEARADHGAALCRSALARIALAKGRADVAARALTPRAGATPEDVLPALRDVTASLDQSGRTTQAAELVDAWVSHWGARAPSYVAGALQLQARMSRKVGHDAQELAAACALASMGLGDTTELTVLAKRAAAETGPRRKETWQQLSLLDPSVIGRRSDLADAFSDIAEAEGFPERAVTLWETGERDAGAVDAAPRLELLRGRLESGGRADLAARLERVAAETVPAPRIGYAQDRADPPGPGEILVRFGLERVYVNVRTGGYRPAPPKKRELAVIAGLVQRALATYPDGFADRLGLLRVVVSRHDLNGPDAHGVAGRANFEQHEIDLVWNPAYPDSEWLYILHHELGHHFDGAFFASDPEWLATNAPGWKYTNNYEVFSPALPDAGKSFAPGIVTEYAAASMAEDKAVIWSNMISHPAELAARTAADPIVAAKVALLRARAARLVPGFDAAYFESRVTSASTRS